MTTPKPPEKFEGELPTHIKLSELSLETLEVLDHFGIEAPSLLNKFAIALEDALIEQAGKNKELHDENKRLKKLLTDNNIDH
jgi:hypothetical protein